MTSYSLRRGYVMDRVNVDLRNCYGIQALKYDFKFADGPAYALYAPNGAMKSSLAQTFQDVATGKKSMDRLFPHRETIRHITDKNGDELGAEKVLVV